MGIFTELSIFYSKYRPEKRKYKRAHSESVMQAEVVYQ
jgi:hypothetical protein